MRIADEMYAEWVEGEAVLLNRESGEVHYLNGTAALVFALIQEHGYVGAMKEVRDRFGSIEGLEGELADLLADMKEKDVLVDDSEDPVLGDGRVILDEPGEPRAASG